MSVSSNINIRVDMELEQDEVKHGPNAVTKAALAEYEEMQKNPGSYQRYHSFDDLLADYPS